MQKYEFNEYDEEYQDYVSKKIDIDIQVDRLNEYIRHWKMVLEDSNNEIEVKQVKQILTALEYAKYSLEQRRDYLVETELKREGKA